MKKLKLVGSKCRPVSTNNNKLYPAYQPGQDLMLQATFEHLKIRSRSKK